ncbi:MAG: branched-chain amino acid ABC transporter substrate-binding protein [Candidatus Edwardsbacteria bacterium]|nr:branched-chain amino acid ABC transporter substrate-binding protein [Candidatus Edwardsbacteria bacterium]
MKKTAAILLTAGVLITLAFSGCGPGGQQIKIGVAGPLTGEQGKAGQDVLHGVQLAVSEWNAKGGVLGKRIVIIAGDDRAEEKEASVIAERLAEQGVVGIIGHYNSHSSIAGSRIYSQRMIPQISPASTNPRFTENGFANVFRTCGRDDQQGKIAAGFALNGLKAKKIAVFSDGTTYGKGLADEFKKAVLAGSARHGGQRRGEAARIVAEAELPLIRESEAPDYAALLDPLLILTPDLIYFGGNYPEGAMLIRRIKERKQAAAFLSGDAVANSELIKRGGMAAEGIYFTFGPAVEDMPQSGRFYGSFKARYGELGPYSVYAYDAASVLLQAIEQAKTTAGDSLVKVLHARTFGGAMGEISFDAKGDITAAPYVIWTVKGGEFKPVKMQGDSITQ